MEMIYIELQQVNKKLQLLIDREYEHSIEEISLSKACKILHKGDAKIKQLVKTQQLKAIVSKDSKGKLRYRFRIADIREYQRSAGYLPDQDRFENIETTEDLVRRIFGVKKKR